MIYSAFKEISTSNVRMSEGTFRRVEVFKWLSAYSTVCTCLPQNLSEKATLKGPFQTKFKTF